MLLYDSPVSGNCYKVRLLLAHLGLEFERRTVDVVDRSNRPDLLGGLNPALRVPTLVLDDGRPLAESGAILWYFGEGTRVRAGGPLRAGADAPVDVLRAVRPRAGDRGRALPAPRTLGRPRSDFADRLEDAGRAGYRALDAMERSLAGRECLVGDGPTLADIALYAYTHVADEGGFDLAATRRSARGSTASRPCPGTSRSTPEPRTDAVLRVENLRSFGTKTFPIRGSSRLYRRRHVSEPHASRTESQTPWGPSRLVERLELRQRAGDRRFASVVELLETERGERARPLRVHDRRRRPPRPVTLRARDLERLRAQLASGRSSPRVLGLRGGA